MTDKFRNPNDENRDVSEVYEADRLENVTADHQHGTSSNEGTVSDITIEDQLREDIGIVDKSLVSDYNQDSDGDPEREILDDLGLVDSHSDNTIKDK